MLNKMLEGGAWHLKVRDYKHVHHLAQRVLSFVRSVNNNTSILKLSVTVSETLSPYSCIVSFAVKHNIKIGN